MDIPHSASLSGIPWFIYPPVWFATMPFLTVSPSSVQCPRCGQPAIVEYRPTVYHCLNCDFEKDLSQAPDAAETPGFLQVLAGAAGTVLIAALI